MFSGGKDSVVLLRLAEKAFRPGRFLPVLHVDTGHNFPRCSSSATAGSTELDERADRGLGPGGHRRRAA